MKSKEILSQDRRNEIEAIANNAEPSSNNAMVDLFVGINIAESEIESKDKEIAELKDKIHQLAVSLNSADCKIEILDSENVNLKEEVERLKTEKQQLQLCNQCKFPNCECHFK